MTQPRTERLAEGSQEPCSSELLEMLDRFLDVQIQWKALLYANGDLIPIEKVIAAYLVDVRLNRNTSQLNPGVKRIALDVDVSARTVQRAIANLAATGWFFVHEGGGRTNTHKFQFGVVRIEEAEAKRVDSDKVVTLSDRKGRHRSRKVASTVSSKRRQECRHNSTTKKYKKNSSQNRGHPLSARGDDALAFVPAGGSFCIQWSDRFLRIGIERLGRSIREDIHHGQRGYWLPSRMPAPRGSDEWDDQLRRIQEMIRDQIGHAEIE